MTTNKWRLVWITGASSGIGRRLALDLAAQGVTVAASARSADGLAALQREAGELLKAYPLDVADAAAVKATVAAIERDNGPIGLAILGAAVWKDMRVSSFDIDFIAQAMNVNYLGVINCIAALLPAMTARRAGQIAPIASVAGYRGLPGAIAYGPTKAAMINLAESLRPELSRLNIDLSLINPGFVDTPMTRVNDFPMPFMVTDKVASQAIINGLAKRKFEIAFPWQLVALLKFARVLPYPLYFRFVNRFLIRR